MKIHGAIKINGKRYPKGANIPWYAIYPFFLIHMLMFGGSGFFMAYSSKGPDLTFIYMHGGIAIVVYTIFYLSIFGIEKVKWMFINAGLGLFGIYAQIGWILGLFGKNINDYPLSHHLMPFLYYILYTFLLHQMILDLTKARETKERQKRTNFFYVLGSLLFYGGFYFLGN